MKNTPQQLQNVSPNTSIQHLGTSAKANTILFLKTNMFLYERLLSAHTNHSTPLETTVFRWVRQKQKVANIGRPREEKKNLAQVVLLQVFDLICAHELLIMQPTFGQLQLLEVCTK